MRLSIIRRIMKIKVSEADNILRDLHDSLDVTSAEFNNHFIIHSK